MFNPELCTCYHKDAWAFYIARGASKDDLDENFRTLQKRAKSIYSHYLDGRAGYVLCPYCKNRME